MVSHLSVQACSHCNDASCFIVDGEHIGGRTLGVLRQDLVTQHPVCSFGVIFVHRRHSHNKCSYGTETQRQDANIFLLSFYLFLLLLAIKIHQKLRGWGYIEHC